MRNVLSLNTREEAVVFWGLVLFIWILTKPEIRTSLVAVLKAFFAWQIFFPLLMMFAYIALGVYGLAKIDLWHWTNLKDTLFWMVGSIFLLYFRANEVVNEKDFFRSKIRENFEFAVILAFIVNMHTFNIAIELILIPVLVILGLIVEFSKGKKEYEDARKLTEWILGIIGISIFILTLWHINWSKFATPQTLFDFLLPFILTITALPFIYVIALLMQYEFMFSRIDIFTPDQALSRYAKRQIFRTCNIHLYRLHRLSKTIGMPKFDDKEDVKERILSTAH